MHIHTCMYPGRHGAAAGTGKAGVWCGAATELPAGVLCGAVRCRRGEARRGAGESAEAEVEDEVDEEEGLSLLLSGVRAKCDKGYFGRPCTG